MSGKETPRKVAAEPAAAHSKPKAADPPITSGSKLRFVTHGSSSIDVVVLLSKIWASPYVGVYIDIPATGSAAARCAYAAYVVHAFRKAAAKIYRVPEYGEFNPKMGRDGMFELCAWTSPAIDGAPNVVRIHFTAKGTKIGQVIANLLARACFAPASSDLSNPVLIPLNRDHDALDWAANKFISTIQGGAFEMVLVGGKRVSVKASAADKFKKSFSKKFVDPKVKAGSAPKEAYAGFAGWRMEYAIPSGSAVGLVAMAHALSGHGPVWCDGKSIGIALSEPEQKWAKRALRSTVGNPHKVASMLVYYQRVAKRDPLGSLGHVMAIAGLACGLPITIVQDIAKTTSFNAESVGEAVAKVVKAD